jgi:hypothetical protein
MTIEFASQIKLADQSKLDQINDEQNQLNFADRTVRPRKILCTSTIIQLNSEATRTKEKGKENKIN